MPAKQLSEAEIFAQYLKYKYNLEVDYLETNSTNCGNNITNLLKLLEINNISFNSIIIAQDATMQHRMDAILRKCVPRETRIINFATYKAEVVENKGVLEYKHKIHSMWRVERYISLLMGEVPRLQDDENGYGPKGKNFLTHVDIPDEAMRAFTELKQVFPESVREANPQFSS
ncbi:MAG: ElyC/SanA/YdcF family protein [Micrococcaceae bacterium]